MGLFRSIVLDVDRKSPQPKTRSFSIKKGNSYDNTCLQKTQLSGATVELRIVVLYDFGDPTNQRCHIFLRRRLVEGIDATIVGI
jgi:hypothetical protein